MSDATSGFSNPNSSPIGLNGFTSDTPSFLTSPPSNVPNSPSLSNIVSPAGTADSANSSGNTSLQIKLISQTNEDVVIFNVSPEIDESGNTIYPEIGDINSPASIIYYRGSPSRIFTINAKLLSRTKAEAAQNYTYKSLLQAWRMPQTQFATPEIIYLYGYGQQFQQIPTAVMSVNISYPIDVDYIDTGTGTKIPIVWPISISLKEYRTQVDLTGFSYASYKAGNLGQWN